MSVPHDLDPREQSFLSHLVELRARLLRAVLAVLLLFIGLIPFANKLYTLLAAPLLANLPEGAGMVAIEVISPFMVPIKLAFFVAVLIAMPVLLYQLWAFVAPGLYRHERRLAKPLLFSATILFYIGSTFAYFLVLPVVFKFLTATTPEGVAMMTDISRYFDFVLVLLLAFGFCFEVPIAIIILVLLGWVSLEQLKAARSYVIVVAFVIAAVVTPPDVVSQLMLAIPMCLLYELGLIAARPLARGQREPADAA